MSKLTPIPSNLHPSISRSSIAASDTTYHSFHDVQLYAPPSPPKDQLPKDQDPTSTEMRRQDSGYESLPPRLSMSSQSRRRTSNASSAASSSQPKPRGRPSIRRSPKTSPYPCRTSGHSLYPTQSQPQPQPQPASFFHFPTHPTDEELSAVQQAQQMGVETLVPLPPQTTHYWTSDRTRRLEYAAIDAASRGVKGWVRRHLVPECFLPKERQHVGFDDDTGSVRRYRLELDEGEESCGKDGKRGWPVWGRRTTA